MSTEHLDLKSRLRPLVAELAQVARQAGALSILLISHDGNELLSWYRHDQTVTTFAGLVSGQYMARRQLAHLLGTTEPCTFIIYEHEEGVLLTAPLSPEVILVTILGTQGSLGAARLALLRLRTRLTPTLIDKRPATQPAPQGSNGFPYEF